MLPPPGAPDAPGLLHDGLDLLVSENGLVVLRRFRPGDVPGGAAERDRVVVADGGDFRLGQVAAEGIEAEVIDLRTLKPLDINTIVNSVKKTGRLVCVSEAYENTGFINEVMMQVNEQAFDYLDGPMIRVAAANVPVPRAETLEDEAIPNTGRIMAACRKAVS